MRGGGEKREGGGRGKREEGEEVKDVGTTPVYRTRCCNVALREWRGRMRGVFCGRASSQPGS